ncbi:ester cyclase [Mycolicibacterium sp. J2]|uniref:ester cyclase n=1 Tax=Mycolicibacterium sp. J2 TaxID=2993511 RepID=UPI00224AC0AC|nr:ester cyclase [Mycolicibacterium sp. J2]MCX2713627.1 ester cyclase [Mycolicibacterium sp. J2]
MSSTPPDVDPAAVVRRNVQEVQNGGDFAVFDQIFADDFVDHTPQQGVPADRTGVRTLYGALRNAFSDLHAEIHWQTVQDDKVTTFKTYSGVHRGTFLGVAATQRPVRFQTLDVFRVHQGRLTDHWGVADLLGVLVQLGALPSDIAV